MNVYDRWGNLVFNTKDEIPRWDGKLNGTDAAIGVYVYIIEYKDFKGESHLKSGDLTLLR